MPCHFSVKLDCLLLVALLKRDVRQQAGCVDPSQRRAFLVRKCFSGKVFSDFSLALSLGKPGKLAIGHCIEWPRLF